MFFLGGGSFSFSFLIRVFLVIALLLIYFGRLDWGMQVGDFCGFGRCAVNLTVFGFYLKICEMGTGVISKMNNMGCSFWR